MVNEADVVMGRRQALASVLILLPLGLSAGCEDAEVGSVPKIKRTKGDKDTGILDPPVKSKGRGVRKR